MPKIPYGIDDIIAAGVFLTEAELTQTLNRLRSKKNLILQGRQAWERHLLRRSWPMP